MNNPFSHIKNFLSPTMASLKFFLSAVLFLAIASNVGSQSTIRMFPTKYGVPPAPDNRVCESWKFSFEAGNGGSGTVPERCVEFVKQYFDRKRYLDDCYMVGEYSYDFAKTVKITTSGDGKDAWIFGVDEALLSNLPYYEEHGYGSEPFDENSFNEWVEKATARALPSSLRLYKRLLKLGFKIILLTGRDEISRNSTEQNLLNAGYSNWEKLILRGSSDQGKKASIYKSEKRIELIEQGYKLHGNSGDQWSDFIGDALATRSFKLPNPLYYIA